jgi:hypothetical protein
MARRLTFTTRDWMWLCVVFALAIGWGGQFRYYRWLEENLSRDRPANATVEEMQEALDAQRNRYYTIELENAQLNGAIQRLELTAEQQETLKKIMPEWKPTPPRDCDSSVR